MRWSGPGTPTKPDSDSDIVSIDHSPCRACGRNGDRIVGPIVRTGGTGLRGVDGDVLPLVRPVPDYPPRAITGNIEGWVQLRFNVTAAGTVKG